MIRPFFVSSKLFLIILVILNSKVLSQHPIFCSPEILNAVADSGIYQDSKQFVDLTLRVSIEEALNSFKNTQNIGDWIKENFFSSSTILIPAQLPDFQNFPPKFHHLIGNPELLNFALDLNTRWKELARKVKISSQNSCYQNCTSFIPDMHNRTIIIPGGRFKQAYYWDSFWIIRGLITCGMLQTAQHLLQNFMLMISKYGFIPNGFRLYYLNRSQPPFFGLMVKLLSDEYMKRGMSNQAYQFRKKAFPHLVAQHKYFMTTHAVEYKLKTDRVIRLNVYNADSTSPRPESYKQDRELVRDISDEKEKARILKGVNTMAESGWDFSSRWLKDPFDLKTNAINQIIPSDLNTILALVEGYLVTLSVQFEREDLRSEYYTQMKDREEYFMEIYNGRAFPDSKRPINSLYPSDFYPFLLFPQLKPQMRQFYHDIVNPSNSQIENKMQWDKPNVWAPNNWLIHEISSVSDGLKYAQEWISTTYCSWKREKLIYEKYRNDEIGRRGQGGQYGVQTGFGWTNGLSLYYLQLYGDQLVIPEC